MNIELYLVPEDKEGENFIKLIEQIMGVYNERCRYRKAKEKEEYERVAGIWNNKY